jgi:cytidine deaminase
MIKKHLASLALEAANCGYAPYTKHLAGAALLGDDGAVYLGANIEIAGSSTSCCATRTALVSALAAGCRTFSALAVTSDVPEHGIPLLCGVCRQAVSEYCHADMPVYLVWKDGSIAAELSAAALIPGWMAMSAPAEFRAGALQPARLPSGAATASVTPERLIAMALEGRRLCYAPYSRYHVGAALLAGSGRVYVSGNTETACRSTAICAERGALFQAVFAGERRLEAIAIAGAMADTPPWGFAYANPCAVCRQALAEFADDSFLFYLARSEMDYRRQTLGDLLPQAFRISSYR